MKAVKNRDSVVNSKGKKPFHLALISILTIATFFIDLSISSGIGGGLLYVVVSLLIITIPNKRWVYFFAILCSSLSLLGFFLSIPGGTLQNFLLNRGLALYTIWITVGLSLRNRPLDSSRQPTTEEALQISEKRYRLLVENAPICIHEIDLNGNFISINQAGLQMLGVDDQRFVCGRPYHEIVSATDRTRLELLQERARAGETLTFEFTSQCDHEIRYFSSSFVPLPHPDGTIHKLMGVSQDISKRKRSEEFLKSQRAFFRQVIDINPNLIFAKDREGRFSLVNQALADVYGTTVDSLIGKTDADFNDNAEEVENFRRDDLEVMDSRKDKFIAEEVITDANGTVRYLQTVKRAIIDEQHHAHQVLGVATDITKRKEAENKLRESEERFRLMADRAPVMIWMAGTDSQLTYFNLGWLTFTGRPLEKEIGTGWTANVHSEDLDRCIKIYQSAFDKREIFQMEYRLRRFDGEYRWILESGTPRSSNGDTFTGYIGTCVDITDQKRIEEVLRNQAKLFDNLYDAVILTDLNGRITDWNSGAERMFGYTRTEILGETPKFLIESSPASSLVKEISDTIQQNLQWSSEIPVITKDRQNRICETIVVPLVDENEKPVGTVSVSRDVTERRQAEIMLKKAHDELDLRVKERTKKLVEVNKRLEQEIADRIQAEESVRLSYSLLYAVTEGTTDAVFVKDLQGRYLTINSAGAQFLGKSKEEIIGKDDSQLFSPQTAKAIMEKDREIMRNAEAKTYEEMGTAQGITRTYFSTKGPQKDSHGNVIGVIGVSRDITERKQTEKALYELNSQLEQRIAERTSELSNALSEVEQLKNRLQEENIYLKQEIKSTHNFEKIITTGNGLAKVLKTVEQVANSSATVLILGESGTGKELIARAIHDLSARQDKPLVKVDCSVLPKHLIESELFGHEKGAFTGAINRRVGRFELADGGTVFLDEIGDLPIELQTKLLRVLQDGAFERLGSTTTIQVDTRIIAATNRDLETAVLDGQFREDLYFRLNVVPIHVPPLRERREDIPLLAAHFLKKYSLKLGKEALTIPVEIMHKLQAYHWQGNVRELENIIERSVILAEGPTISLDDQFAPPIRPRHSPEKSPTIKEMETRLILHALQASNWVIQGKYGAAARLDMAPSTLRERIRKYQIKRPS